MRAWFKKMAGPKNPLSHDAALRRIASRGLSVATLIDVGAAEGGWTLNFLQHWPEARCHLIEAKEEWRSALEALRAKHSECVTYVIKGAAAEPGEAQFSYGVDRYAGAVLAAGQKRDNTRTIPVTSIDAEVETLRLKGPFCIKLDTHGSEVDILSGARQVLAETSLLCIETYNFFGQKRFPEMIQHLRELGFRVVDMAEPLFRPSDAALWQIDFYFQRADDPVFHSSAYDARKK